MLIYRNSRTLKIIAAVILVVMTFLFIHSELEQFSHEGDNHRNHDYCEIVDGATRQTSKVAPTDLLKLKGNNLFYIHCLDEITLNLSEIKILALLDYHSPQRSNEIFLHNRTFLI